MLPMNEKGKRNAVDRLIGLWEAHPKLAVPMTLIMTIGIVVCMIGCMVFNGRGVSIISSFNQISPHRGDSGPGPMGEIDLDLARTYADGCEDLDRRMDAQALEAFEKLLHFKPRSVACQIRYSHAVRALEVDNAMSHDACLRDAKWIEQKLDDTVSRPASDTNPHEIEAARIELHNLRGTFGIPSAAQPRWKLGEFFRSLYD